MEERSDRIRNPYEQYWFAMIWLVFLIIPIMLVSELSTAGPVWDSIAYACTMVFGVIYLIAMRRYEDDAPLTQIIAWAALLCSVCLPTIPALGFAVVSYTPYLMALGLWCLPFRHGLVWALVLFAVSVLAVLVPFGIVEGAQILLNMSGAYIAQLFTVAFRLIEYRSASAAKLERELAAVHEREEISRDIHDLLGHSLTAISLKAQLAKRLVDTNPQQAAHELDELLQITSRSLDEVRGTVGRLRTPDLAAQLKSVQTMLEAADLEYRIEGSVHEVPVEHRALMAWAMREGVTNLVRHADASEATITIRPTLLRIADNGTGTEAPEGHGLTGLRCRVEDAGATLEIRPLHPGGERPGTCLEVQLQ
nr:histidine kinase [Pseudoclavibacter sp. Marseille-Q3772]